MKRLSLVLLAMMVAVGATFATPVDVNLARSYGQKYVQNTLGQKSAELSLVYTGITEAGMDALYVFNFDQGYVVVAADDRAYPILGYSDEGTLDVANMPDGLQYYLRFYARQIQFAIDNNLPVDLEIADQWYLLGKEGVTKRNRSGKGVAPLLTTTWDQGWPYNMYAPTCTGGSAGHCYAGCVATAMSQNMKYWNWPETGNGEHSYTCTYGTLSVNFGETTYNWSAMTNSVSGNTPAAQAIALLMYHCGVAVDMNYAPNGSGSYTELIPDALINYFRYGTCTHVDDRDNYSKTAWEDMLIESFDRGLPVVYAGVDDYGSGGHAFNCCGYNDERKFYFNWGWSGAGNSYFEIDALNIPAYLGGEHFNTSQRAVFDMLPDYVYDAQVPQISTMEASVADAVTKTAVLSFEVPSVSESGAALESIESIVLQRNGVAIHTFENPQPGETITYEDTVDDYGYYEYTVYGVNNGFQGQSFSALALLGPNCTWKLVCQTSNFQGWYGGKVQIMGDNGVIFKEVTMTSSSPLSEKFQMPEGDFTVNWYDPASTVSSLTITLKNSANQNAYTFTGSSTQLSGTLFSGTNDCPNCTPPTGLTGEYHYNDGAFGTLLTWNCDYDPSNFKIYRSDDGVEYTEIAKIENTEHEYFDEVSMGSYYYKVTAFSSACESTPALTDDETDYVFVAVTSLGEQAINARIFPNPVNDRLSIQANGITEVVVYNVIGQSVYRHRGLSDSLEINTSGLEPGVYTVNVVTETGQASHRFIVMH